MIQLGPARAKKRHWFTTLLAIWMFADALWLLIWETNELYMLWGFYHRPHTWPPPVSPTPHAGLWLAAIFYNFELLLRFFPVPHLLIVVRQTALFGCSVRPGQIRMPWVLQ